MTPAPGWSKKELDAEFGPVEPQLPIVVPSALSRWFVAFKDDVLSGRVSLEELLEVADFDMQVEAPKLCPACQRPVRPGQKGYIHGTCAICSFYRLKAAYSEKIAELEALKAHNAARSSVKRLRDELGVLPDRLKKARDYSGRHVAMVRPQEEYPQYHVIATDLAPGTVMHPCESCGEVFHARPETVCPECRERHERRLEHRHVAADSSP
jgi:ribosomal protein L37AE/L43A